MSKTRFERKDGTPPVLDMRAFGLAIAARKAELGLVDLPRNAGENRTESKRALLDAIAETGARW